ncbi:TonB-dependent receptor [Pelomonas aquatica]|jgi:TonB-dependent receptor|uniref:TonB-dependent receptor n=1 Tax=Pelomonas aquatica TaxID=431058 RepID=A0A9X4R5G0_9BURK|nr:TonB-dependent receptor [Pelomonas aquatica]MCY4754489.1 TonB-dependent receptor [Pelomonas aquatica]MDG0863685.1 TonB-dependent receptor [Pelomonas aquatica]
MKHPQTSKARRVSWQARQLKPVAWASSLALLTGAAAVHAQAQQAGPAAAPAPQSLETVVVTGIRKSLDSAVNLKRESRGLVDGIVAEDIGKFPDTNLAESMQRIAGVSIDRAASGEGSKVTVRGVGPDFNMVLLNGRQMPTSTINQLNAGASGSRAFDFSNLSSDSISALEVYKTGRAESPTGGIGATINVKTARPLDLRERVASIGVKANFDGSNSRLPESFKGSSVTPEVSGIYSDTFADRTIGIAISGSYSKRDSGSNMAYTQGGWRTFNPSQTDWGTIPAKPATGTDPITNRPTGLYSTSVDMRYSLTAIERERFNGQMTLQFAPSKDLRFTLDYTMATNTLSKKNAELSSWFNFSFGPTTFTSGPVASPLVQTALWPNGDHDLAINSGAYGEKSKLGSTGFNTAWKVSNALSIDLDAHHSTSSTKPNSPYGTYSTMDLGLFNQGNAIAYYDQKLPILSLPTTTMDASKLQLTGSQFVNNMAEQTVDQFQTRGTYRLDADNKLLAGLGFTKVKNRAAGYNNQNNDWGGVGVKKDYANVKLYTENLGGFFSQIPGHNDPRLFQNFYLADFNSLHAAAIQSIMASRGLTQAQAQAYFSASPDYTSGNDWRTTEKSSSFFGQWDHAFDTAIPMNVSVGLRYESTKVDSSSQVVARSGSSWGTQNEVNLGNAGTTFGSKSGKYSYWLPSIDWDADVADNVKLRASYGENIGRPGWDQLQGGVNFNSVANAGGGTGSTGDPALKPLQSKNLDLSAEWYYAKSSYAAIGAFYKKVSNFIGTSTTTMTVPGLTTPIGGAYWKAGAAACGANPQPLCIRNYIFRNYSGQPGVTATSALTDAEVLGTITGQPTDPLLNFTVTKPSNEAGDNIKGLELNFQHMFGNSGFGISGNYTWVKTGLKYDNTSLDVQSALPGVSNSANLVGFYEDNTWSVRGAYNWRGEFLAQKFDGAGNNPVYTEAYGQMDMSIGYKLGKSLTIQADLLNLNDGYIRQHGRAKEQLISAIQTGRRYLIGARYRF